MIWTIFHHATRIYTKMTTQKRVTKKTHTGILAINVSRSLLLIRIKASKYYCFESVLYNFQSSKIPHQMDNNKMTSIFSFTTSI
uniref:Putative ovule protein n=1 Tax=Solanum chacoense TaxID=4108 RepID=A0A0V0HQW4_SOLCH